MTGTSEYSTFTPSNLHHPPFQTVCHSTTTFIAHFVNQGIAPELIAQILVLFPERPTDNTIEIAVGFAREVGSSKKTQQRPTQRPLYVSVPIKRGQVSVIASRT